MCEWIAPQRSLLKQIDLYLWYIWTHFPFNYTVKRKNTRGSTVSLLFATWQGWSTKTIAWHVAQGQLLRAYLPYLGAGMDWRAPSWPGSWGRYRCWLETEDMESWARWEMNRLHLPRRCCCLPHCVAAGRTLERWRSGACAVHCGWDCGIVPANYAVGWTRCAVVPGQGGALDGGTR